MKIILAIEGDTQNKRTIEIISKLRLQVGDEIIVLSVVDLSIPPMAIDILSGNSPSIEEIEEAAKDNARQILAETSEKLRVILDEKKIEIKLEMLSGSPESRIVEKAEEVHADLIIVGSHGYNRWERLLLGSVSDSVIHHAPCSVLVVRDNKFN